MSDWQKQGEESLLNHILLKADYIRQTYPRLKDIRWENLLEDPMAVRFPTQIKYKFEGMASHQPAHPQIKTDGSGKTICILFMHPSLEHVENDKILVILYYIPVINYGEAVITDEECLKFTAKVLNLNIDSVYNRLCTLADSLALPAEYDK